MAAKRIARVLLIALLGALVAGCAGMSVSTAVRQTWKDPKYTGGPMKKIFVVSLMEISPGGRNAVEDAIVAQLEGAGVAAVASHSVLSNDAQRPGPTLTEAIRTSGADGVLLAQVLAVGSYESYTVGATVISPSPDTMASYKLLKSEGADQKGDYKVARISSEIFVAPMGRQVWTAWTDSYDAANLARNIPDYTLKLVTAMAKDGMIAGAPKPRS